MNEMVMVEMVKQALLIYCTEEYPNIDRFFMFKQIFHLNVPITVRFRSLCNSYI